MSEQVDLIPQPRRDDLTPQPRQDDLTPQPPLRRGEGEQALRLPLSAPERDVGAADIRAAQRLGGEVHSGLLAPIRFGWHVVVGAARDFVWADLRDGILDLRGLGSPLRALVWLGFGLLLATIVAILYGDLWRQSFPLVALTQGIPGRGRLVPSAVIPVTYFLLSLAWSFVLAGALRSRRLIRFGVLGIWALTTTGSMVSGGVADAVSFGVGLATLLAVPIAFAIFACTPPRRVLEMLVLLALVTANNAVNQIQGVGTWQTSGMPLMVMRLSFEMAGLSLVTMPLLLLVGMDVAGFTFRAASWVTSIAEERLARWVPGVLLAVLLAWRLWETLGEVSGWLADGPLDVQLAALAGGLAVPVLVGVAWLAVRNLAPPQPTLPDRDTVESTVTRLALPVILSYTATLAVVVILSGVALVLTVFSLFVRSLVSLQEGILQVITWIGNDDAQWFVHIIVSIGALVVAVVLARRGQHVGALFLGILGLLDLWGRLIADGRPLEWLAAAGPGNRTEVWWVLLFVGLAVFWLARRELTVQRASVLAFATLTLLLLRQTDFISNRFSPFVASGGLGFLAFGIVWDALTIGSWANEGSRGLPRVSRIFLYLGYVLMTVTVINWAVASHDLGTVGRLTGDVGLVGLEAFGKPLLYTIIVVALAGAFRGLGVAALGDPAEPSGISQQHAGHSRQPSAAETSAHRLS